jgi:TolB-like protein/class 3 adenylate cyclase/Tfp pilus assembly protein PilF
MPRRLAAIMFTDIAGYTQLAQTDESGALRLLQEQEKLVRPLLAVHQGRKVKSMGDGLLLEFEDALDAVEFGAELQRQLHERNAQEIARPLRIRVGIHLGDVQRRGTDILGDAVNIASRIEPLAEPGGICISEHVFAQVRNKVAYPLEQLGPKSLKGVREPIDVYRVVLPWATGDVLVTSPAPPRLAVLPLTNISPDPTDEYFADGLTEELIATISKVRELSVISRTSVMQYKNQTKHAPEIGRELNAGTILEGSVRKAGNRVRVAVQLIDAAVDKHLWAENYDRSLEDIFSIQSEIAEKVAKELQIHLLEQDRARLGEVPTGNTEAHLLYLKGMFHYQRGTKEGFLTAVGYFEQAIQKDPRYALAYAALATTYGMLGFFDMIPSSEADAKVEAATKKAVELDDRLAEAHIRLGWSQFHRHDFRDAIQELQRAVELNPSSAQAHLHLGNAYYFLRRFKEAAAETQKALELDPQSEPTLEHAATNYLYSGQPERAAELYTKALQLNPSSAGILDNLGLAHVRIGRLEEGIAEIKKAIAMSMGSNPADKADLVYALSRAGRIDEARGVLSELVQYHEKHGSGATQVAEAFASVGDAEAAFEWLEKAHQERSGYLLGVSVDFAFESMHTDPRFQRILEKIGYPPKMVVD